ncbi:MAG: GNAT family protein, partial [Terracidiphilus sp.]
APFTLGSMLLRPAVENDIARIVALERTPVAQSFVGQWTEERHRATLSGSDARYFVADSSAGDLEAYIILRGLSENSGALELKRIVVAAPGRGLGRKILANLLQLAFEDLHAHRLFLDVFEDNARARHLYESLGFVYEGVMRDAALRDGHYFNLHLMSMLESEYHKHQLGRALSQAPSL